MTLTVTPFAIGFQWPSVTDDRPSYPPHNVVREESLPGVDEERYSLELALAGFQRHELNISVHNGSLTVKGEKTSSDTSTRNYLHRGIGTRKFEKEFSLAEFVEVTSATFEDGILRITLVKSVPTEKKPKKIQIDAPKEKQLLNE